jgi:hypothetical protein
MVYHVDYVVTYPVAMTEDEFSHLDDDGISIWNRCMQYIDSSLLLTIIKTTNE